MLNKEIIYEVCRLIMGECPNRDEGGLCSKYNGCLECWRYEIEKELYPKRKIRGSSNW